MEQKRKGSNTVNLIWELAEPLAEKLGLILWDVKFQKEGANWYLRIIIDKEGGVNINDCVAMNDALDEPLDALDPIEQSYNLQIQSAGIERELVRDFHFQKYLGEKIILKLRQGYEGAKIHHCFLKDFSDGNVTVTFSNNESHTFTKQEYASVKLDDFDEDF